MDGKDRSPTEAKASRRLQMALPLSSSGLIGTTVQERAELVALLVQMLMEAVGRKEGNDERR